MKSFIFYLLAKLMPTKSVEQAVRVLNDIAKALDAAEMAQVSKIEEIDQQLKALSDERSAANAERQRAASVRKNITSLLIEA